MTDLIVSGVVYALTLIGLIFLVKGNERKLLSIGYGFLTLFAFKISSVLIASAVAIGLAFWLRAQE
jgi:hypothetical protein